jgi:hypothetical protein
MLDIKMPQYLFRIMVDGPDNYRGSLADVAEYNECMARSYTNILHMEQEDIDNLELDFAFPWCPMLSGPVTKSNVGYYVELKCRDTILGEYDYDCLRELYEGFNATKTDHIRPTPEYLWSTYSNPPVPSSESIIRSIRMSEHADCVHYTTDTCWCGVNAKSTCPISALCSFLSNAPPEGLSNFLNFVTATKYLALDRTIKVQLVNAEAPRLPTAQTCSRTLCLYVVPNERELTPQEAFQYQSEFNRMLLLSIENSPSFSVL